ncbi:MAG: hypothetical protein AAB309_05630 [Deltaproteobacteria bacterium]
MRLYWELSRLGAPCIGKKKEWPYDVLKSKEELILLASDMLRFDPRLLSILIIYFLNHWYELNPLKIRIKFSEMKTSQVLGVIKEFLLDYSRDKELKFFFEYLTKDLKPVSPQLFFLGLFAIGSERQELIARKSLKQYSKWGFLGDERPQIDPFSKKTIGSYDIATRKRIIEEILRHKKTISLRDYLNALDHSISTQQALYDLKQMKGLKLIGSGRGAKWKKG